MSTAIKNHLQNQLRLELEASCPKAAISSLALLGIYQFTIRNYFVNDFPQFCVIALLISNLLLRLALPWFKKLPDSLWLNLHSLVIVSSSILWSLMLSNIAFTDLRAPELHIITALLFIGLVAAAAISLAISKRDFYGFVMPLISMQIATFYIFNYDPTFQISANLIAALFVVFLALQRKRIELNWQNVRTQHFELQEILDAVPGGISVISEGRYKIVNSYVRNRLPAGENLVGKEFGSIMGKDNLFAETILNFGNSAEQRIQFEAPLFVKNEQRNHLVSASKMGQQIVISTIDTHELKKAQLSLMHNARMASLGEMSSGLSHEINNPVAIISMRAQQMQMSLKKGSFNLESFTKGLEVILSTADRISRIAKGLRSFSQTRDDLSIENANLRSIVEDALTLCQEKMKNSRVQLETDIPELIEVSCNSSQISQVILNALNNSFDAIANSAEKWIRIKAFHDNDFVTISITDSGPGIPAEIREKVMQPFFTTKEVGKGTGLGLSISKGIVESHKGQLYFNFEQGQPTELRIVLPAARRLTAVS
jgi:signal transduction histidine kinase